MTQKHFRLWVFALLFAPLTLGAQEFFRFRADFSIKEKTTGAPQGQLVTGTVYFDKNVHKINHEVRFPERERWLVHDTTLYRVVADTLAERRSILPMSEFSIYNTILSQQLSDFGLGKGGYTLGSVEDAEGGKVISTWLPPAQLKQLLGKVVVVQEQKRVTGVAFYDQNEQLQGKFYFRDYVLVNDLPVPSKIYQILNKPDGEFTRILEFKNVVINQPGDDEKYDFPLPAGTAATGAVPAAGKQ